MTLSEVKAWAHIKEATGPVYETTEPDGYRRLGKRMWVRELPPVVAPQRTIFRFELTIAGAIQRAADDVSD